MDYDKINFNKYENYWKSLNGKFSNISWHYSSNVPSPAVLKVIKFFKDKDCGRSFLDIGCGNGRNTIEFAKNKYKCSGIDISKSAIRFAKQNAKDNNLLISNRVGSVLDLPYKPDSFDLILDSGCLHHLRKTQWKQYIKNILTVLKSKGYFLLICFSNKTGYLPRLSPKTKKRNWTLKKGHYNHFFTDIEIKTTFKKYFDVVYHYEMTRPNTPIVFKVYLMKKK